jgi:hypothetical protein
MLIQMGTRFVAQAGQKERASWMRWAWFWLHVNFIRAQHESSKPLNDSQIARLLKTTPGLGNYRHVTAERLRHQLSHPDFIYNVPTDEFFPFIVRTFSIFIFSTIEMGHILPDLIPMLRAPDPSKEEIVLKALGLKMDDFFFEAWKLVQEERSAQGKPPLPTSYYGEVIKKCVYRGLPPLAPGWRIENS